MIESSRTHLILLVLASAAAFAPSARAADAKPAATATPAPAAGSERVNVDAIKEKYWARGDESEIGVVQNRAYTKKGKWHLGVFGGVLSTDPFWSTRAAGLSLGYNFSEYFALNLIGWKSTYDTTDSFNAYQSAISLSGGVQAKPARNDPKGYYGAEAAWSLLYGKLSLLGAKIIYYDLHILGGLGWTPAENGGAFTPSAGLGQQFYLNRLMTLRVDYRVLYRQEQLLQDSISNNTLTTSLTPSRANWTHAITVGIDFFFGGPKDDAASSPSSSSDDDAAGGSSAGAP